MTMLVNGGNIVVFSVLNILLVPSLGLLLLSSTAEGMTTGAPKDTCPKLEPQHPGTNPSTDLSPYRLHVEPSGNDGSLKMTLNLTKDGVGFKGFLIAVRKSIEYTVDGAKLHGTFDVSPDNKLMQQRDCASSPVEGVFLTHLSASANQNLKKVEVIWHPPSATARFKAQAVAVQGYTKYWIKIPSPEFDAGGGKTKVYERDDSETQNGAFTVAGLSTMWMAFLCFSGLFLV